LMACSLSAAASAIACSSMLDIQLSPEFIFLL
jgi:hypothetical protein